MKALLAALAVLLVALPASAQIHQFAFGWGYDKIDKNGVSGEVTNKEAVLKYEVQLPFGAYNWVGLGIQYGIDTDTKGLSIRHYFGDGETGTFPGIGIAAMLWSPDDVPILDDETAFVGPEFLVEFDMPEDLPIVGGLENRALAFIRYLPRVQGDQGASEFAFGIDLLFDAGG